MAQSGRKLLAVTLVFGAGYLGALITPSGEGFGSHVVRQALGRNSGARPSGVVTTLQNHVPTVFAAAPALAVPEEVPEPPIVTPSETESALHGTEPSPLPIPKTSPARKRAVHARAVRPALRSESPRQTIAVRSEIVDPWASAEQ